MNAHSAPSTARQIREAAPAGGTVTASSGATAAVRGGALAVPLGTVGRNTSRPYGHSTRTVAAGDRATAPAQETPALDTRCEGVSPGPLPVYRDSHTGCEASPCGGGPVRPHSCRPDVIP